VPLVHDLSLTSRRGTGCRSPNPLLIPIDDMMICATSKHDSPTRTGADRPYRA